LHPDLTILKRLYLAALVRDVCTVAATGHPLVPEIIGLVLSLLVDALAKQLHGRAKKDSQR
jgi:hypothetical protein